MIYVNLITLVIYVLNINLIIKNMIKFLLNKDCPYLLFHSLTELIIIYILIFIIIFILLNYLYLNYKIFQKQKLLINLLTIYFISLTLKEIYYITINLTTDKLMFEFHLYTNLKMIIFISLYLLFIKIYLNNLKIKSFFKSNILINQMLILFIIIINILPPQISLYILIFLLIFYNIENNKKNYLSKLIKNNYARGRI